MNLTETIAAAGMTPPRELTSGRWLRFPGVGKGKSNRAGWCRIITPTLAIFGDWSSNFSATWRDEAHQDTAETTRLLAEAREREKRFAAQQVRKQAQAAQDAERLVKAARIKTHCYLARKGFPDRVGLVHESKLLIPMRDVSDYDRIISVQLIAENGEKRFLPGGRTRGGIYRIGAPAATARKLVLCEGYATGLSIETAMRLLSGPHTVVVCFSARNLELVAENFSKAAVCADNDESKTGEDAAKRTGLPWIMPPELGADFNDMHRKYGLHAVTDLLRSLW